MSRPRPLRVILLSIVLLLTDLLFHGSVVEVTVANHAHGPLTGIISNSSVTVNDTQPFEEIVLTDLSLDIQNRTLATRLSWS